MVTWFLYPLEPQRGHKNLEHSVMWLSSRCRVRACDDGSIELVGDEAILTREYRETLLPYVQAIWGVLNAGRSVK